MAGLPNIRGAVSPQPPELSMLDVIMLAIGIGSFALLFAYVALCERL
jgi:hypothetical protein